MTGIEKLAMQQIKMQLYAVSGRIDDHFNTLTGIYNKNYNDQININSTFSPMSFIKSDMDKLLKDFQSFEAG